MSIALTVLSGIGLHSLSAAQSDPPTATPSRVAVDEKQIEVDGEKQWLYAAIDIESRLLLEIDVFGRRGTDPTAAFLHRLTEKHDVADTEFLINAAGYLTALARRELSGQFDYRERNQIEKWFQTVTMRIDRFHAFWRGSQSCNADRKRLDAEIPQVEAGVDIQVVVTAG